MNSTARIAILPREVASQVITTAVARGSWGVSLLTLMLDLVVMIDLTTSHATRTNLLVPCLSVALMLVLVATLGWKGSFARRILLLCALAILVVVYQSSAAAFDPGVVGTTTYVINRPLVALTLLTPLIMRPLLGVIWSTIGLGLGFILTGISSLLLGTALPLGWGPVATWGIAVGAYATLTLVRRRQSAQVPDLVRLEEETTRLALENQFEQRAAAIIHDTVLSDLTVVMNATGILDDRARARFRADVATLADPSWLSSPAEELSIDARDVALRNGLVALASELQWRGLTVDVTGGDQTVIPLDSEAVTALLAAVRACLENVLLHSGTRSAELVLSPDAGDVTVMIIDHGVGFDPSAVAADRLGLRSSVVARIESRGGSVRVWSRPGSGTSVVISMPMPLAPQGEGSSS